MCNRNKTTKSTVTQAPLPFVQDAYKSLFQQGATAASQPFTPYGGTRVPALNPAFGQAGTAAAGIGSSLAPYLDEARGLTSGLSRSVWEGVPEFSAEEVSRYQNPYTQSVVDATLADLNRSDAMAQNELLGRSIMAGGSPFGGDRAGLAAAALAGEQSRGRASTVAGLRDQSYQQALDQFNAQQGLRLQGNVADRGNAGTAAQIIAGLGGQSTQAELDRINAMLGVAGVQQGHAQATADTAFEDWQTKQQYPFEVLNFLAGIYSGGPGLGGSSVEEKPKPGILQQILGAVGAGLSLFKDGGSVPGYADGGSVDDDIIPVFGGGLSTPGRVTDIDLNGDPILVPSIAPRQTAVAAPRPTSGVGAPAQERGGVSGFLSGLGGRFEEDPWRLPLLMAGLGMMTSDSPTFLGAVGEGGLGAVATVMNRRSAEAEAAARQAELDAQTEIITDPATGDMYVWHPSTGERTLLFEGAGPNREYGFENVQDVGLVRTDNRAGTAEVVVEVPADPGFRLATPEERAAVNYGPNDPPLQVGPDNRIYEVGGGGVEVNLPGQATFGTVPAGFARVEDPSSPTGWRLVPEPGGEPATEIANYEEAVNAETIGQLSRTGIVMEDIDRAIAMLDNPLLAGWSGQRLLDLGVTPAVDLASLLTTINSSIGIERLLEMKAASPTGASGFGALTAPELQLLLAQLGSLNQAQSADQLRRNLLRVQDYYSGIVADLYTEAEQRGLAIPDAPVPPIAGDAAVTAPATTTLAPGTEWNGPNGEPLIFDGTNFVDATTRVPRYTAGGQPIGAP